MEADDVVYDVSARNTFDELLKWFKEIDTYCGEGVVKVIVGNKTDKVVSIDVLDEGRMELIVFRNFRGRYLQSKEGLLQKG